MAWLRDIAQICKSKNAGPFQVTIDVLFEDHALYRQVKATGVLNAALFARLYGVAEEDVLCAPSGDVTVPADARPGRTIVSPTKVATPRSAGCA